MDDKDYNELKELYLESQETQRKLKNDFDRMIKVLNDLTNAMGTILEMTFEDEEIFALPEDMPIGCGARQYN